MTDTHAADWEQARRELATDEGQSAPTHLSRFFAFVLDVTLIVGMVLLVEAALGLTIMALAGARAIPVIDQIDWYVTPAREVYDYPIVVGIRVVTNVLAIAYLPWFWARGGQTPAMSFLGFRVARAGTHGELGFRIAIVRFVALLVSIVSVVGVLWVFVDRRRRGWHDIVAGTVVIRES